MMNIRSFGQRVRAAAGVLMSALAVLAVCLALHGTASSQELKGQVRVPTSHANVHMGPTSTQQVLVMVAEGTVLPVIERRGEWIAVRLSPDLRKTGIPLRWYRNEDRGYMHDSTVEFFDVETD